MAEKLATLTMLFSSLNAQENPAKVTREVVYNDTNNSPDDVFVQCTQLVASYASLTDATITWSLSFKGNVANITPDSQRSVKGYGLMKLALEQNGIASDKSGKLRVPAMKATHFDAEGNMLTSVDVQNFVVSNQAQWADGTVIFPISDDQEINSYLSGEYK